MAMTFGDIVLAKNDNTQLSYRTHKISDSEDTDKGIHAEDQRITLETTAMSTFLCQNSSTFGSSWLKFCTDCGLV
jgi:hypothetical protein